MTDSGTAGLVAQRPAVVGDGTELLAWAARMRAESAVWHDETTDSYHVFQHAEASRVLSDPGVFSSDLSVLMPPPDPEVPNFLEGSLTVTDPPWHTRLRKLVSGAFTPRVITGMESRIATVAEELLDAVADWREFDLVADFAHPLPVIVIAEMLGIPPHDRAMFRRWAEALLAGGDEGEVGAANQPSFPADRARDLNEMSNYLAEQAAERRRQQRDDLISRLVAAEADGAGLTDKQIINFSAFLLFAGHFTTTLLLGNTLLSLRESSGHLEGLRSERDLIRPTLEEVLRFRPPTVFLYRMTTEPVELGRVRVPANKIVVIWLISANRDPVVFTEPDTFQPQRSNPQAHLTFSHGIHFCLGAPLARAESAIALNLMLDRYSELHCGRPVYFQRPDVFGVRELPLSGVRT